MWTSFSSPAIGGSTDVTALELVAAAALHTTNG
jgi:hypothetical protein